MADVQLLGARGLTEAEVDDRRRGGLDNRAPRRTSRPTSDILRGNLLTAFNGVMGALCVLAVWFGGWRQGLFGLVIVANAAIGTVQELRAKRTLDSLSLLSEAPVRVRRDGEERSILPDEVVRDDLILVSAGDAVIADGRVVEVDGLEVDESLLTGEAEPVVKAVGDSVRSGAFIVSGSGGYTANKVGGRQYVERMARRAGAFSLVTSPLRDGISRFVRGITWVLVPVGVLLVFTQSRSQHDVSDAILKAVAGVVPMIPEGLVLLTSIAFAVGVIRLGERRCLVQELHAVEGLARVDVLCLDKTGTLTENGLEVVETMLPGRSGETALAALAAADTGPNPTMRAIARHFRDEQPDWAVDHVRYFSSERTWSGVSFTDHGHWVLGAPEVVLRPGDPHLAQARRLAKEGMHVVALATADDIAGARPENTVGEGIIVLRQRPRRTAAAILRYFERQGVSVKIFSGDDPVSVGAVGRSVGVAGSAEPVDATELPEEGPKLWQTLTDKNVFGRVTPQQKSQFVSTLQAEGHTVAMIGDGVNDILALKKADLGIAMGSGAPAARGVADVVLLNDDFATLPHMVDEGRRVIGNIERVGNLFLTKTVYSVLLALAVGLFALPYPFLPLHITLIGALTIGVPAFFMALAPGADNARPGFVPRILRFAVPAGVAAAAATFAAYALSHDSGTPEPGGQSAAALALFVVAFAVLVVVARPLTEWRLMLVIAVGVSFLLIMTIPALRGFFMLGFTGLTDVVVALVCAAVAVGIFIAGLTTDRWWGTQRVVEEDKSGEDSGSSTTN